MRPMPRILVVDDEVEIQELFKRRFKDEYDVSCATFQDEALEALKSSAFDLVLLDLKLPRKKSDMAASPEVGVDILRRIRKEGIRRRGSEDQLPVVVMTAFGADKLFSAEFLGTRGASDYIQKPFGPRKALKLIIERALGGEGALAAPLARGIKVVQLRFNTAQSIVLVESIPYSGVHYELLHALHVRFLEDQVALRPQAKYGGLRSLQLAERWGIGDQAVRQRVTKFREAVGRDFREKLGRALDRDDVVENPRTWDGYRLNPFVVRLVAWEHGQQQRGS
jgi:CheY-like chemotaxis protein